MDILTRIGYILKTLLYHALEEKLAQMEHRTRKKKSKKKKTSSFEFEFEDFEKEQATGTTEQTPRMNPVLATHYAALEIPYGSDLPTVTAAWKRLLKKYHPDRYDNDPERVRIANQITLGLNEAYRTIQQALKENRIYE